MSNSFNLRYFFSYLGLLPYLFLLIDKTFFNQIQTNIINDFYVYYSLIIIVFIGAINWNLKGEVSNFLVIYGFLPSVFAVMIIILQLFFFNYSIISLILMLLIFFQLIIDYFFLYNLKKHKKIFFLLRFPLSMIICLFLTANLILF